MKQQPKAVLRLLLRAVNKHITSVAGNRQWRQHVLQEFRHNRAEADATQQQRLLLVAQEYADLVNNIAHHQELLATYNIGLDPEQRNKQMVEKTAARVGFQLPTTASSASSTAAIQQQQQQQQQQQNGEQDAQPQQAGGQLQQLAASGQQHQQPQQEGGGLEMLPDQAGHAGQQAAVGSQQAGRSSNGIHDTQPPQHQQQQEVSPLSASPAALGL